MRNLWDQLMIRELDNKEKKKNLKRRWEWNLKRWRGQNQTGKKFCTGDHLCCKVYKQYPKIKKKMDHHCKH